MLLQLYMYYYCSALERISGDDTSAVFIYGVERVLQMCDSWSQYFAPSMLRTLSVGLDEKQTAAWESVMDTADCVELLASRCRELLQYAPHGTVTGILRRQSELQHLLSSVVLPKMVALHYDQSDKAEVVKFIRTDRILTSFVPFESFTAPAVVPGAYSEEEHAIVEVYLNALRNAPSMANASGSSSREDGAFFAWHSGHELVESRPLTSLEANMVVGSMPVSLVHAEILNSWRREIA